MFSRDSCSLRAYLAVNGSIVGSTYFNWNGGH